MKFYLSLESMRIVFEPLLEQTGKNVFRIPLWQLVFGLGRSLGMAGWPGQGCRSVRQQWQIKWTLFNSSPSFLPEWAAMASRALAQEIPPAVGGGEQRALWAPVAATARKQLGPHYAHPHKPCNKLAAADMPSR